MSENNGVTELYKKYRPKTFKEVLGQSAAVKQLTEMIAAKKVPHCLLFIGPSGCSKTTLARIVKDELGCSSHDFTEVNCANDRGIDLARDILARMSLRPMAGPCRVWLLDEVGRANVNCMSALLKALEDTPSHVYFMLATTDPHKLLPTIHTRSTVITVKALGEGDLISLAKSVLKKEGRELDEDVLDKLAVAANGSARKALVLLEQVLTLPTPEEQIESLYKQDVKKQGVDLAKLLIDPRSNWKIVAALIKGLEEEAESVRRVVLSYASKVLLNNPKAADRCYLILTAFESNFYDSGTAGLVRACYEVYQSGK